MEYVYAALLLHKLKQNITEDNIANIIKATGVTPDDVRVKALVAALSEVNIEEALKAAPVASVAAVRSRIVYSLNTVGRPVQHKERRRRRRRRRRKRHWKDSHRFLDKSFTASFVKFMWVILISNYYQNKIFRKNQKYPMFQKYIF